MSTWFWKVPQGGRNRGSRGVNQGPNHVQPGGITLLLTDSSRSTKQQPRSVTGERDEGAEEWRRERGREVKGKREKDKQRERGGKARNEDREKVN